MIYTYINSVGIATQGIDNWHEAKSVLANGGEYIPRELESYKPALLPPNERRRATHLIKLAFKVSEEATQHLSEEERSELSSTFVSSDGDYAVIDQICSALAQPSRMVSPTQFHNSVHNAAAGYWSIASKSRASSNSISAFNDSFAAGIIESMTLVASDKKPTLLTIYDTIPPFPISEKRKVSVPFALALVLSPQRTSHTLGKIGLQLNSESDEIESICQNPKLEELRQHNPAARSLPLISLIANSSSGNLIIRANNHQNITLSYTSTNE